MASAVKEKLVTDLRESLNGSPHVVVTQYQGLTAEELDALRAALRPLGARYKVVKNRLAQLAFKDAGFSDLNPHMKGPSAIVFQGTDAQGITRALFKFGETHEKLKVRAGHVFGAVSDSKDLKAIANLPSKEVLLSTLLARLNSPLQTLAATLNEPLRSLHTALSALSKKKEATPA